MYIKTFIYDISYLHITECFDCFLSAASGSRPNFGEICWLALITSLPLETQWLYCLFCSGKPVCKKRVQFMGIQWRRQKCRDFKKGAYHSCKFRSFFLGILTDLQIFVVKTSVNSKPTSLLRPYFYVTYLREYCNVTTLVRVKFNYGRQVSTNPVISFQALKQIVRRINSIKNPYNIYSIGVTE